ncbi:MAG: Re/Si-specific NAD(P)(+) transhydrogenase subunit alpha [Rhodospirillales bacterium]|nr:Re/Si-specific NAD(P)(+) transhydrogenase subunit alpha [Rhodospirillales bacterium]
MGLKIAIAKETSSNEKRVAVSPETVKKLADMGALIMVESGAGETASFTDDAYKASGAKISKGLEDLYKGADIVLKVQAPNEDELKRIPKGALLIGLLSPFSNAELVLALAKAGVDGFAMEMVPRISRAQSMDALSSQSNLAGYKSVLDATEYYPRAFPMMMTAAGTIPPAKVFVMGAGVAGLQAIATARRLGAVVSATDVRPAAKEQVESLGASFVAVENEEFKEAETSGGYAKEMSKDYQKQQAALVAAHIAKQDIVITTALIPGRPAPKLISEAMVQSMKPGSVIVDLAVETGGNCAGSKAGKVVQKDGVTIIGHENVPSRLAADASALYAKNLLNLLKLIIDAENAKLAINWDDEIIKGMALTKDGAVIHPAFTDKKVPENKKIPEKKAEEKKTPAPKKKAPAKKSSPKKEND